MKTASDTGMTANYVYNFKGQRVFKSVNGEVSYYIYNDSGQLIAEADNKGKITSEYIFLNGNLLAKAQTHAVNVPAPQQTTINHQWKRLSFKATGANPVVFAEPASFHDQEPGVVQIQNVSDGRAEVRFAEWAYLDDRHLAENVSIMALPEGRYTMADGSIWEIGTVEIKGDRIFKRQLFSEAFPGIPTVILTAQSANDGSPYSVSAKKVSATRFRVGLYEEEKTRFSSHTPETIGYLAIYSATGAGAVEFNRVRFDYKLSTATLDHHWKTLMGYLLKIEEEKSQNREVRHKEETINILLMDGLIFAQNVSSIDGNTSTIRRKTESTPVNVAVKSDRIYYYHNSHLGTPEVMTDAEQNIVWQVSYSPFGSASVSVESVENNIRFPGQYYDAETGLHYNYFRYYDVEIGRYVTSDPIGLAGGINTYGYVGGSPLNFVDPLGLLESFTFDLNFSSSSNLTNSRGKTYSAFSGEPYARNNPTLTYIKNIGPIMKGKYYIVDRPTGGIFGPIKDWISGKNKWFALYRDDGTIDDSTPSYGLKRGNFRLHPGSISYGCITLSDQGEYKQLRNLLLKTKKEIIPNTKIPFYGTIIVK